MSHAGSALVALAALALLWSVSCGEGRQSQPPPTSPEPEVSADLEPFLESYFATWSRGDMEGYRDHFHERAVITLVKNGRVVVSMPRDPFVEGQQRARDASDDPGVERMTSFRADEDRYAATVAAEWELVEGSERTVGVDRFTLIRDQQWRWKIVSLVFYATGRGHAAKAAVRPREKSPGRAEPSSE